MTRSGWRSAATAAVIALGVPAEGRAQQGSPPLAGEVWRIPTAVLGAPGTRVLRLDAGGGLSDRDTKLGTFRLAFSLALLPRLELQVAAAIVPLDGVHAPLDGGLRARWGLRNQGPLRIAVLGEAHFGGLYVASHEQRRVASAGSGLVVTACGAGCRATASWQATVGVHDVDLKSDFLSAGYRRGHAGSAVTFTLPLQGPFGLFAAARATITFACGVRHGESQHCTRPWIGAATLGGRASWLDGRFALDVGLSILRGPILGPGGPSAPTAATVGAIFSSGWDGAGD